MTVEQALNGLQAIITSQPNTSLADRAIKLSDDIITRQMDSLLPAKDS